MRPRLYTIAAGRPFLASLAAGLLDLCGGDPLQLARAVVLLPTRRAVRALREAFLQVAPAGGVAGTPLLLPRLYPIGDLDDEAMMPGADGADDVPPALSVLRRHLLLIRLVLKWGERRSRDALLPGQAAALAATLARLIDTVASEGASFAGLAGLVPADLAEHWQVVQRFLEILPQAWPQMLAAEGALDMAERRNRLLRRQAQAWRRLPPAAPVIAAGLGGGMPAVTELLAAIAALPAGAVILAGLDRDRDDAEWQAIAADEAHPQHLLALLLQTLDLHPSAVQDWPPADQAPLPADGEREKPTRRRLALVAEALRPAATTDAWRRLPPEPADTFAGVSRYDCPSAQQEAVTIALLLRRKLETPGATAALITPDRDLARRVAAELRRWDIAIDDSAGLPLNRTPPGVFLRLVLELAGSRLAPVPLLAALAHPLAAGGMSRARFRDLARRLERAIRGPRPAPDFAGLKAALAQEDEPVRRFVATLETCLGALPRLLAAPAVALAELAKAHFAAAERLAASDEEPGGARLWREATGEIAARFCHELIDAAKDFPPLPGRHYPALFEALAADTVVRPAFGRHPRLAIWGLIEARLQQADLIVLGGLNEGSWPAAAEHDPWMSRQMRRAFGIAVPERAIGIAAHDFAQALGAAEVALTRATRQEGVPTVPSRWLLRLDTVLRAIGCAGALAPDPEIESAAALIDERAYRPLPPAQFCPPLAARPRRLSVTEIETWMRDPYAVYARHVLRLRPLDPLDADPGRAELGTVIHQALEIFVARFPRALPEQAERDLLAIGRECFAPFLSRPGAWTFWWPRFEKIALWFVAEERRHRAAIAESLSECRGSLVLPSRGGPFTITAKADRIDRLAAGGFLLADYKTGMLPRKKEVEAGLAPQLTLEGAILRGGGFAGIGGEPGCGPGQGPLGLEYWRLSGGDPAGERQALSGDDAGALIDGVLDRVQTLIAHFDDPATPYLATPAPQWAPRFSDYDHLERLTKSETAEWE